MFVILVCESSESNIPTSSIKPLKAFPPLAREPILKGLSGLHVKSSVNVPVLVPA